MLLTKFCERKGIMKSNNYINQSSLKVFTYAERGKRHSVDEK